MDSPGSVEPLKIASTSSYKSEASRIFCLELQKAHISPCPPSCRSRKPAGQTSVGSATSASDREVLAPGTRRKAGLIQALGSPEAASWIRSPSENNAALRSLSGRQAPGAPVSSRNSLPYAHQTQSERTAAVRALAGRTRPLFGMNLVLTCRGRRES